MLLTVAFAAPALAEDRPDDLVIQASGLVSSGDWAKARWVLDRVLAADPDHLRGLYYRALCRLKLGDPVGASTDLDRYESLATDDTDQEPGQSLRVQIDNAQPAPPKKAPKAKAGPEVGFVVVGIAVAAAGGVFLATGLSRGNAGAMEQRPGALLRRPGHGDRRRRRRLAGHPGGRGAQEPGAGEGVGGSRRVAGGRGGRVHSDLVISATTSSSGTNSRVDSSASRDVDGAPAISTSSIGSDEPNCRTARGIVSSSMTL